LKHEKALEITGRCRIVRMPTPTSLDAILEGYPVILLDAYGVLVHSSGAMAGARALIERLRHEGRRWFVLTNDASRLPDTAARHYQRLGLEIPAEAIITSGQLIARYFHDHGLRGAKTIVFGTPDSVRYVEQAGGIPVPPHEDAEVIAICDEAAGDFLGEIDHVLSTIIRAIDRGRRLHLILPNPDLIYPKGSGGFGIAAGSVAVMIEHAIALRTPSPPRFVSLGKPFAPIFEEAERRSGTREMILIGDQIETDILGARRYGITSALVATGVSQYDESTPEDRRPDLLLESLA
jgi:HAD superfamily hydrolase (TIGR01450 family)